MIARFKNNSYRWSPLAVALIVILCCISLPDARSGEAAQPSAAEPTGPSVSGEQPAATRERENNVFVDPQTGIRFTKSKTISGPSDVIAGSPGLNLSPNGKFLLWGVRVVPLDGSAPFDLVNTPNAGRGSWSPDGKKVVFYAGAMWLIEVAPETGRPAGSARELLKGEYWAQAPVRWSSDSKRIVFERRDSQVRGQVWTISIESGELSQVTDPFSFGLVSPDGKMVACSDGQGVVRPASLRVRPVVGGEARNIMDGTHPVVWSASSEWLVCKPSVGGGWGDQIRFVRVADGREVKLAAPGYMIRQSPHSRKLLFYHGSYDYGNVLKVISVTGGPATELGRPSLSFGLIPGYQLWTRDSGRLLVEGEQGNNWGLWSIPLEGKAFQSLAIDTPQFRQASFRVLSPDGSKLLLSVAGEGQTVDLWVVPISLAQMKSTGPAVKIFGGVVPPSRLWWIYLDAWSPDSSKIAFIHNWDVWVASADGKSSTQFTQTAERDVWPDWSPDGTMIAYGTQSSPANTLIRVVPASGGEARIITDIRFRYAWPRFYVWSPDGKELTIASEPEGVISNFPISGGDARTVVRLKDLGIDRAGWLRWSPDGRLLAFQASTGQKQTLYTYQPDRAKPDRLSDSDNEIGPWYWSPDNKWISFFSPQTVKTRPEGILWEMDVEEALAKLAK